MLIFAQNRD